MEPNLCMPGFFQETEPIGVSECVCASEREGRREREKREREIIYFRKLAHANMKADICKTCRGCHKLETQVRASVAVQVQKPSAVTIPSCSRKANLCSFQDFR